MSSSLFRSEDNVNFLDSIFYEKRRPLIIIFSQIPLGLRQQAGEPLSRRLFLLSIKKSKSYLKN